MRDKSVPEFQNRADEVRTPSEGGLEERARYFLSKAADAQQQAANSDDPERHNSWLEIAERYRQMARQVTELKL
jgi:hypothetical protein